MQKFLPKIANQLEAFLLQNMSEIALATNLQFLPIVFSFSFFQIYQKPLLYTFKCLNQKSCLPKFFRILDPYYYIVSFSLLLQYQLRIGRSKFNHIFISYTQPFISRYKHASDLNIFSVKADKIAVIFIVRKFKQKF